MVDAQLNIFDTIVIGILVLSSLIAFFRGFVREVLSLGAWVGSAIITVYFFPDVAKWLEPRFTNPMLATGAAVVGTYITALLVISLINAIILRYVKAGNEVGLLDNMLGLLFGAARGAFIISLGFLLMTLVVGKEYPVWVEEAQTREWVEMGAQALANVAPEYLEEADDLQRDVTERVKKAKEDSTQSGGDKGYKYMNVKDLDRLIDSNTRSAR